MMDKILKLEDVTITEKDDRRVAIYIFNDDTIVRIDADTDELLSKKVPEKYLDLISIYESVNESRRKERSHYPYEENKVTKSERIRLIKSGKGAGWGVFCALVIHIVFLLLGWAVALNTNSILFTVLISLVIPIIMATMAPKYLEDISDKEYLETCDMRSVNFQKGFYPTIIFGWLPAIICCAQWKEDMLSVINNKPSKYSKDKHTCFVIWELINYLILPVISFILFFIFFNGKLVL